METTVETTLKTDPTPVETFTMKVNGRDYKIAKHATTTKNAPHVYFLTGKRGAQYGTMRNANNPEMMFLIDLRGFGIPAAMDNVWLSDKDGTLRQVRLCPVPRWCAYDAGAVSGSSPRSRTSRIATRGC